MTEHGLEIILLGASYKTAPVEFRERMAFTEDGVLAALSQLVDRQAIGEGLIVSTCNRVEIVLAAKRPHSVNAAIGAIQDYLEKYYRIHPDLVERHCYRHVNEAAVKHLFRVTSSLDSMVVGEPQITGQIKEAFQLAQRAGTAGHHLTRLMNRAFAVAKRVRNETAIGSSAVSISYVAVELARRVFETLQGATVMLIGAGEMAELAARHLVRHGAAGILIANRTFEHAVSLAESLSGRPIPFAEIEQNLPSVDVLLCSTGAGNYLLHPAQIRQALDRRRNRPVLLIDISVPRNLDPAIGRLDNVFLFDIDDLASIAEANQQERQREAQRAEALIEVEVERFMATWKQGDVEAVIRAFHQEVWQMAMHELDRSRKRLGRLDEEQEEALRIMLRAIVQKVTHPVIHQLRQSEDGHSPYLEAWRALYHHPADSNQDN